MQTDQQHVNSSRAFSKAAATGNTAAVSQQAVTSLQWQDGLQDIAEEGEQGNKPTTQFQLKRNDTGLPDRLKTGIEQLSGIAMDDVKVHYNDSRPAQLQALAYARGTEIHIAPGQERHVAHEAWHVVQQKQGKVSPTIQYKGTAVNDDPVLEKEADHMGAQADVFRLEAASWSGAAPQRVAGSEVVQRLTGYEIETQIPIYGPHNEVTPDMLTPAGKNGFTPEIGRFLIGGLQYGDNYGSDPEGHYHISADHNDLSSLHLRLVDKLLLLGLLSENWRHRGMANIEYITPPRNELAPAAKQDHAADIALVKAHLNTTLGIARTDGIQPVPAPAHNVLSGVPVTALNTWLTANGIPASAIAGELGAFATAISNEVYIQETSGVLPQDVPGVYTEAVDKMRSATNPDLLARIMSDMMSRSIIVARAAFAATTSKPPVWTTHQQAITGFLTLLSSYVMADELSYLKVFSGTSSVAKNLVPFMSKAKLEDAIKALPATVLPAATKDAWVQCIAELRKSAQDFDMLYWSETYSQSLSDTQTEGQVFPNGVEAALTRLIDGTPLTMHAITGRPLGLDEPHADVKAATGQQAIPLEDRFFRQHFDEKLTAENMEAKIAGRFTFATRLQLSHLPEEGDRRRNAETLASTPLAASEQPGVFAELIRKKITQLKKLNRELIDKTLMTVEIPTDPWDAQIGKILTDYAAGDQQAALVLVNKQVSDKMTELHEMVNKASNENKSGDNRLTYAGAFQRFFKNDGDMRIGRLLLDFQKKNLQAGDLRNEVDIEEMKGKIITIERCRRLYNKKKEDMAKLITADTPIKERLTNLHTIEETITKLERLTKGKIAEAEVFYNTHDKKVEETKTPVVSEQGTV